MTNKIGKKVKMIVVTKIPKIIAIVWGILITINNTACLK